MLVKITLNDLFLVTTVLQELGDIRFENSKIWYTISRNTRIINTERKHAEDLQRDIFEKYSKENEEGVQEVPPRSRNAYRKAVEDLSEVECELDGFRPISLTAVVDALGESGFKPNWFTYGWFLFEDDFDYE